MFPGGTSRKITEGQAKYLVVQNGTMDGGNCRSPQGVWQPFQQTWESNRSVRMENLGETDIVNPWLSNGRNDFRSLDEIVARVVRPGMTDAEKARALWWQQVQYRFHLEGDNQELLEPVKVFNLYGYNTCGNDSICLAGLWHRGGPAGRSGPPGGALRLPSSSMTAAGTSWMAICTRSISSATTKPSQESRTWCATTI
jgi:hypothetical protein